MIRALRRWWDRTRTRVGDRVGTPRGFGHVVFKAKTYLIVEFQSGAQYLFRRADCWRFR